MMTFNVGSFMGQWRCKVAELSCHRLSLFRFLNPFVLGQGACCLCFVLLEFCTYGRSLGPVQHNGHNVLPKVALLTLRLWSSAAVFSLASKLSLRNFFLLVAYFVYKECTLSSCPVHKDETLLQKCLVKNNLLQVFKGSRVWTKPGPQALLFWSIWMMLTSGHHFTTCPVVDIGDVVKDGCPLLLEPGCASFTGPSAQTGASRWQ